MIFDKELLFCENQAVTVDAASTSYIDLDVAAPPDWGKGQPLYIVAQVTTAFAGTESPTVTVKVQQDDNTDFSSPTDVVTGATLGTTSLTAGDRALLVAFPTITQRYVRLYFDCDGDTDWTITAGAITAGVVWDVPNAGPVLSA